MKHALHSRAAFLNCRLTQISDLSLIRYSVLEIRVHKQSLAFQAHVHGHVPWALARQSIRDVGGDKVEPDCVIDISGTALWSLYYPP